MSEVELQQFYELCQAYRSIPFERQGEAMAAYHNLVKWVSERNVPANSITRYRAMCDSLMHRMKTIPSAPKALIDAAIAFVDLDNMSLDLDTYCQARQENFEKMRAAADQYKKTLAERNSA